MLCDTRWLLRVPDLDEMRCGTVRLTVPLIDDVIQIGLGGRFDTGTIEVVRRPNAVTVVRADGRPIQARINEDGSAGHIVLREPIGKLTIARVGGQWFVPVGQTQDVAQLVAVIANFALAKQRRAGETRRAG